MKKVYFKIVKTSCNHASRSAFSMWSTPGNELITTVVTLYKDKSHLPDLLVWLIPFSITTLLSSGQQRTTAKFSLNTTHKRELRKNTK